MYHYLKIQFASLEFILLVFAAGLIPLFSKQKFSFSSSSWGWRVYSNFWGQRAWWPREFYPLVGPFLAFIRAISSGVSFVVCRALFLLLHSRLHEMKSLLSRHFASGTGGRRASFTRLVRGVHGPKVFFIAVCFCTFSALFISLWCFPMQMVQTA